MGFLPKKKVVNEEVKQKDTEEKSEEELIESVKRKLKEQEEELERLKEKKVKEEKVEKNDEEKEEIKIVVVRDLPTQVVRETITEEGIKIRFITTEEALTQIMNQ